MYLQQKLLYEGDKLLDADGMWVDALCLLLDPRTPLVLSMRSMHFKETRGALLHAPDVDVQVY